MRDVSTHLRCVGIELLAMCICALFAVQASAQEIVWPEVGSRVRIVVPESSYLQSAVLQPLASDAPSQLGRQTRFADETLRLDGTLVSVDPSELSLGLVKPSGEVRLAVSDISLIETHTGSVGRGGVGALIGGIVTGIYGFQAGQAVTGRSDGAFFTAIVGVLPGALIGLLMGSAFRTNTWETTYTR